MKRVSVVLLLIASLLSGCGDDGGSSSSGGEERTVLVDFRHDEFAGTYPFACVLHPQMVGTLTVRA